MDACVPEDFYSTTNHRTQIRLDGSWEDVARQRMDAVVVVEDGACPMREAARRPEARSS